jgi:uncharacterized membrane protein YbhN (UPF0104 family)
LDTKKILKYSKWLWIAFVVMAVGYYLITKWELIGESIQQLSLINILICILLIILAKFLLVVISQHSIKKEGFSLPYRDVFRIVSFTHLAKYIPGGIWHFVGRFSAYNERDMKVKSSTKALVHENIWLLSGAFFTGSLFGVLSSQGQRIIQDLGVEIPFFVIFLLIILVWVFVLFGYERIIPSVESSRVSLIFVSSLLAWILLGISFGIILPEFSSQTGLYYISIYSLGWIAGYVAVFAPGGIGIRETVLVWMLGSLLDPDSAIVYSSVHRFMFIIAEILLGGVSLGLGALKKDELIVENNQE